MSLNFTKISPYALRCDTGHKVCKCFNGESWKYMIYPPGEGGKVEKIYDSFEECKNYLRQKNDYR